MRVWFLIAALGVLASSASAAEPKSRVLLSGLDNPAGVAVQPKTGDVFVSDSGAGKILRVAQGDAPTATPVVTGFKEDIYGKGPKYKIGPLGLAFADETTLVVGGGDHVDGEEVVYVFDLPSGAAAVDASKATAKLGPIGPGDASPKGEGNFYGVALTPTGLYITANGDDTKGWVLKSARDGKKFAALEAFLPTKPAVGVDAPVGITVDAKGHVVIGQMGEINVPQDSLLTVYDESGKLISKHETGLFDITGLAYSPKTGKLYATDFAWMDDKQGGLFELAVAGDAVKATKVLSLNKPTALAFSPDGVLYVTVIGTADEANKKPGQLIEVTGDL